MHLCTYIIVVRDLGYMSDPWSAFIGSGLDDRYSQNNYQQINRIQKQHGIEQVYALHFCGHHDIEFYLFDYSWRRDGIKIWP